MKNYGTKVDYGTGVPSMVFADELNSLFQESMNLVKMFEDPKESDQYQTARTADLLSRSLFYKILGTPNNLILYRENITSYIEEYIDGMSGFFSPNISNTGTVTLSLASLGRIKAVNPEYSDLTENYLKPNNLYLYTYNAHVDGGVFVVYPITNTASSQIENTSEGLQTSGRLRIVDNSAYLPRMANGDVTWNAAMVFESIDSMSSLDVTCQIDPSNPFKIIFDPLDEVDGMYCVVSYIPL